VAATAERTTIATTGLTKRYGRIMALDDVTVEMSDDAIGLLGANGAGKSTLMKALLGLVKPDAGSPLLLGIDAASRGLELRRRIGYMPEHECLPSWMTARDLVVHLGELRGLPRRIAVLRTSEVLFQVGLEEERLRLIGTFSTGMRQRVKLAQALVHSPELVVLDEPTNGLDPQGRDEMLELVRRLSRDLGIRVLFSSHVLEDVERTCDAVIVLRDGRVAAQGRISELLGRDTGTARLSAIGDLAALRSALAVRNLEVEDGEQGWLAVRGDAAILSEAIRDACAETGVSLRALLPGDRTLEDAVIGAIA
jgi:ABC-2 type transport system ATP-binding protein